MELKSQRENATLRKFKQTFKKKNSDEQKNEERQARTNDKSAELVVFLRRKQTDCFFEKYFKKPIDFI